MQVTSSFFSIFRNLQLKNLQLVDEQKKGVSKHPLLNLLNGNYSWPSNSAPALNLTTFFAGIWIVFPVCGFLPALALLSDTEKDHLMNSLETIEQGLRDKYGEHASYKIYFDDFHQAEHKAQ